MGFYKHYLPPHPTPQILLTLLLISADLVLSEESISQGKLTRLEYTTMPGLLHRWPGIITAARRLGTGSLMSVRETGPMIPPEILTPALLLWDPSARILRSGSASRQARLRCGTTAGQENTTPPWPLTARMIMLPYLQI